MRHSGRLDAALTTTVSHRKLVTFTGLPDAHYIALTSHRDIYLFTISNNHDLIFVGFY